MTFAQAVIAFTLAAALLTVTPGLDTALVLRTAAVEGARTGLKAAIGICLGCFAWGVIVALGLGALLAVSEFAYDCVRILGAAYLLYLGIGMIRAKRHGAIQAKPQGRADNWLLRGFLNNLLNPKVGLFYVTLLPQFVPQGVDVTLMILLLVSIHAIEGMLWFLVLIGAVSRISRFLADPVVVKTLDRVTGTIMIAFGVKLALESRN